MSDKSRFRGQPDLRLFCKRLNMSACIPVHAPGKRSLPHAIDALMRSGRLGPATGFDLDDEVAGDPVEETGSSRLIVIDLIDLPTQYLRLSLSVIYSKDLYNGPLRESRPAAYDLQITGRVTKRLRQQC